MIKWRHGFNTSQFNRHPLDRRQIHRTMRKMRADSSWNRLKPEQFALLDDWLFEERLSYAKVLARAEKEFGLHASMSSIGRYYRMRAKQERIMELIEAQKAAWELNDLAVDRDELRTAVVKLVGKAALKQATEQPEQVEQLALLTKLLLKSEENDIRRARLKLAEKYFDYEKTAACQEELPQVRAHMLAIGRDTSLSHDEKMKRSHELFFGSPLPESYVSKADKPENGK
jgi:hypothetical protein